MFSPETIKKLEGIKTPFYYYDTRLLEKTLEQAKKAAGKYGYHVHYALKANASAQLLHTVRNMGFGADCVSGNEVKAAVEHGFDHSKIVFAGVGKSDDEILFALQHDIFCFNCESLPELEVIQELAASLNKKARVALRINPNVNANTHKYITTGLEENKFGINLWELNDVIAALKTMPNLEWIGLHFHIGSQITDMNAFKSLCLKVNNIQEQLLKQNIRLPHLNLGGGLGINYQDPDGNPIPDFSEFFSIFRDFLEPLPGQVIHFELGRALVAQCASLISKVLYVKKGINTSFVILDAGMTELIRPALYQAFHKIENLSAVSQQRSQQNTFRYDVVGPVCESSDCFGKALELPETKRGDLIAIRSAGAYGEVMSSQYNLRDKALSYFSGE